MREVLVNGPPEASFTVFIAGEREELGGTGGTRRIEVLSGVLLEFDASSSHDPDGEIVEYAWDWESDGEFDLVTKEPVVYKRFGEPGTYEVSLRVTDDRGASGETKLIVEVKGNLPPVAIIEAPDAIYTNVEATFDASGSYDPDGRIVKYEWDFDGDGMIDAEGKRVSWTFTEEGTYIVVLIVTDDDGATARKEVEIKVEVGGSGGPA